MLLCEVAGTDIFPHCQVSRQGWWALYKINEVLITWRCGVFALKKPWVVCAFCSI